MPNEAMDYPAVALSEWNEDVARVLEETIRSRFGTPGRGIPWRLTEYDGLESALHLRSLDASVSQFAYFENHDGSVKYDGNNSGNDFTGPWSFTGAGVITGNVGMTGNLNITGTQHVTGAVDFDSTLNVDGAATVQSTLHVVGAVDFDSTLNVDGAVTLQSTLLLIGALTANGAGTLGDAAADAWLFKGTNTFNEDSTFKKALIVEGNTTLGNASGDTITFTGTGTFAEDVTMSKGLIVDTTTLVVDETANTVTMGATLFQADVTNSRVAIGGASTAGYPLLNAAGMIRATGDSSVSAGTGMEFTYIAGSNLGQILSIDRATTTFKRTQIDGSVVTIGGATTRNVAFYGNSSGAAQQSIAAAATDLASAITLVNDIRTKLRNVALFA